MKWALIKCAEKDIGRLLSARSGLSNSIQEPIQMKTRKILFGALVLALLVAGGLWLRNEMQIDSCLDRGGRWDQERQICEGATE